MTFTTVSVQVKQPSEHPSTTSIHNTDIAMAGMMLSLYLAAKSKKEIRKFKRKLTWSLIKAKFKSLFSGKKDLSNQTLLYILIGAVVLALIIIEPWVGLAVLLLAILVILLVNGGNLMQKK
jgi:cell division protein FtsW (lipid II flippase)